MKTLFIYFSALLLPLMCKQASEEDRYAASEPAMMDKAFTEETTSSEESKQNNSSPELTKELKIIKTGNVRYQVNNLDNESQKILDLTKKHQGYIQNENSQNSSYEISKNYAIRIPHQSFDGFILDLSKGVSYFDYKNIQAQDVTEEFIDIEARLKTQKELEKRYLALLNQAKNIKEILDIEKELNSIRQEIESKEGRLKYLQNKVSWSTIDVSIYKLQPQSANVSVSYFSKIWNAIKSGWNGLLSFFIGLLHIWPFLIILSLIIWFIKRKWAAKKQILK